MSAPPAQLTAAVGSIAAFQPESEWIDSYLERLQLYLTANNFPDERKVAALLTLVGSTAYEVLRSLLAPALPQTKTYDELVQVLRDHYAPKPMVIAERFHFHRRNQQSGESIAEYIAELQKLALHCEFGDYLNQALRDRLVCGLLHNSIQKRLLAEADLTLAPRALTLAQGMEAASKNTQSLKSKRQLSGRCPNIGLRLASLGRDRPVGEIVVTQRDRCATGVVAVTTSQLSAY